MRQLLKYHRFQLVFSALRPLPFTPEHTALGKFSTPIYHCTWHGNATDCTTADPVAPRVRPQRPKSPRWASCEKSVDCSWDPVPLGAPRNLGCVIQHTLLGNLYGSRRLQLAFRALFHAAACCQLAVCPMTVDCDCALCAPSCKPHNARHYLI